MPDAPPPDAPPWDLPESPFEPDEVAGVRRPLGEATMLPARAFVDPDVYAFEQAHWFARDWVCVGRASEVGTPGAWLVAPVASRAGVLVVRGDDGVTRAFHNLCRHRGVTLLEGHGVCPSRIRCAYHAWSYDLAGRLTHAPHTQDLPGFDRDSQGLRPVRVEAFGGFLFVNVAGATVGLSAWLDDLPAQFDGIALETLRVGKRVVYDVRANWKLLMENFAEAYHFGPVHPQLEKLTPSRQADTLPSRGPWQGGWMPLRPEAQTVSLDGRLHGRALLRTSGTHRHGALDYLVWPNLFLSLQPDYLLAYRVEPGAHDATRVVLDVLFARETVARPGFDAPDVYDFWHETNRQDFAMCERQQIGVASRGYVPGRYTWAEDGVHEFDKIAAERYADP